jgi:hypothetical protein
MARKSRPPGSKSLTKSRSIRVLDWSREPTWAELAIDGDERWTGYTFRLSFSADGALSGLEAKRGDDAAPLSTHLLQRVPLGALERTFTRWLDELDEEWTKGLPPVSRSVVREWREQLAAGRPERGDASARDTQLAALARCYVETLGEPGQTKALAEIFSYAQSSIATLVREARLRGLLTPTRKGRPSGQLTAKARALLGDELKNAWEQATDEERAAVLEREELREARDAELLAEYQAGRIDAETFARRGMEIDKEASDT